MDVKSTAKPRCQSCCSDKTRLSIADWQERYDPGKTLLANWVITLDPVFSGLAWAIIFGIVTSAFFTLIVIPAAYWILYRNENASKNTPLQEVV